MVKCSTTPHRVPRLPPPPQRRPAHAADAAARPRAAPGAAPRPARQHHAHAAGSKRMEPSRDDHDNIYDNIYLNLKLI